MKFPFIVQQRSLFWILLMGMLLSSVVIGEINRPLETSVAPQGIVSFQFVDTPAAAKAILASWDARARMYAGFSLGFDYLYMALYMTTLASACVMVTGKYWLAWGVGAAVLCDALENAAQWHMLTASVTVPWPQLTNWCATVKFVLLAFCGLYLVAMAVYRAWRKAAA